MSVSMKYPIHIPVTPYTGENKKRKNKFLMDVQRAKIIEEAFNSIFKKLEDSGSNIATIDYLEIEKMTGLSFEVIKRICFACTGNSGGMTIYNEKYTRDRPLKT